MPSISLHSTKRVNPVSVEHSVHAAVCLGFELQPIPNEVWTLTDGHTSYSFNVMHTGLGAALIRSQVAFSNDPYENNPLRDNPWFTGRDERGMSQTRWVVYSITAAVIVMAILSAVAGA